MTADCPHISKILQLNPFFSSSPIATTTKKVNLSFFYAIWRQLIKSSESLSAGAITTGQGFLSEINKFGHSCSSHRKLFFEHWFNANNVACFKI